MTQSSDSSVEYDAVEAVLPHHTDAPPELDAPGISWRERLKHSVDQGLHAAKMNLRPGIVLWFIGLVVLGAYFFTDFGRQYLEKLGEFRSQYGLAYAAIVTPLVGGIIPWIVMRWRHATRSRATISLLIFLAFFWAGRGVEVSLFYELLAWLFGEELKWHVVLSKVVLDQFIIAPTWFMVSTLILYHWQSQSYKLSAFKQLGNRRWYIDEVVPTIIANMGVWVPAVGMIYVLPLTLQLPMQNLVLCFWSLMLLVMTDQDKKSAGQD